MTIFCKIWVGVGESPKKKFFLPNTTKFSSSQKKFFLERGHECRSVKKNFFLRYLKIFIRHLQKKISREVTSAGPWKKINMNFSPPNKYKLPPLKKQWWVVIYFFKILVNKVVSTAVGSRVCSLLSHQVATVNTNTKQLCTPGTADEFFPFPNETSSLRFRSPLFMLVISKPQNEIVWSNASFELLLRQWAQTTQGKRFLRQFRWKSTIPRDVEASLPRPRRAITDYFYKLKHIPRVEGQTR